MNSECVGDGEGSSVKMDPASESGPGVCGPSDESADEVAAEALDGTLSRVAGVDNEPTSMLRPGGP